MNTTVIIPSLNPDEKILSTVKSLLDEGFSDIILVDDGSDEAHKSLFEEAKEKFGVTLLVHEVNKGKGKAMKTAFEYVLNNRPEKPSVITVDGDGQHLASDVKRCIEKLEENPGCFVMGVRNFNQADVPARSRFGNKVTRVVFGLLCGIKVSDTQTGLRAIPFEHLPLMLEVDGNRYEYETNQLFAVKNASIPFKEVVINTVYIEENQTSHFRPIRDSIRIYGIILKYIASSGASFIVDISIFTIVNFILGHLNVSSEISLLAATISSRIISSLFNFFVNRNVVFKSKTGVGKTMLKYYTLAVCQASASYGLVYLFSSIIFRLPSGSLLSSIIKFLVDCVLFLISFRIQQNWVFVSKKKNN